MYTQSSDHLLSAKSVKKFLGILQKQRFLSNSNLVFFSINNTLLLVRSVISFAKIRPETPAPIIVISKYSSITLN